MIVQIRDSTNEIVGILGVALAPAPDGFTILEVPDSWRAQIEAPGADRIVDGKLESDPPESVASDSPQKLQARNGVVTVAQSAVGVGLGALTAQQQRALLACLLYKVGALDENLTVQPLGEWL